MRITIRALGILLAVVICLVTVNKYVPSTVVTTAQLAALEPAAGAHILSSADLVRYRDILSLQKQGKWQEADAQIDQLYNEVLVGYVLAKRYQDRRYDSSLAELIQWLDHYREMPDAPAILSLLRRKAPQIASAQPSIEAPKNLKAKSYANKASLLRSLPEPDRAAWNGRTAAHTQWSRIRKTIESGNLREANNFMASDTAVKTFSDSERAMLHGRLAAAYFSKGYYNEASHHAEQSAQLSDELIPSTHWIAGLAAWQLNNPSLAAEHFVTLSENDDTLGAMDITAASFWAYRALDNNGDIRARAFLERAGEDNRSFYGILANSALGNELGVDSYAMQAKFQQASRELPAVERAAALTDLGENEAAEEELRHAFAQSPDTASRRQLLVATSALGMPKLQMRLGTLMARSGDYSDYASYPIPNWKMPGGYEVDPALIYAIARQESGFEAAAVSPAGARGVMQIMPETARYITTRKDNLPSAALLHDPLHNVVLGQAYINHLAEQKYIGDNLLYLLAAYNAGPGALLQWKNSIRANDDPLLFIELIPYSETREYVVKVMANYWIYRELLGESSRTPEMLLSGSWPLEQLSQFAMTDNQIVR